MNFVVSDQSRSIKITAWGSASQGKNDTVFLDKLVVGVDLSRPNPAWENDMSVMVFLSKAKLGLGG